MTKKELEAKIAELERRMLALEMRQVVVPVVPQWIPLVVQYYPIEPNKITCDTPQVFMSQQEQRK